MRLLLMVFLTPILVHAQYSNDPRLRILEQYFESEREYDRLILLEQIERIQRQRQQRQGQQQASPTSPPEVKQSSEMLCSCTVHFAQIPDKGDFYIGNLTMKARGGGQETSNIVASFAANDSDAFQKAQTACFQKIQIQKSCN